MVSIQSSYTIIPSEPTQNTTFFSLWEQIRPRTHTPLLYVYKPHVHDNIASSTLFQTLKNSLGQVLSVYYPLAGRLSWIDDGKKRWEFHCNAKGAQLLEAYCETNLDDLGGFVPTQLVSQLTPNIDYGVPIEEMPLLVVQITRFRCGGLTIAVCFCRVAIDGTSAIRFMNIWAKLARGEALDSKEMPCHDRTVVDSRKLNSVLCQYPEFYPPPVWLGSLGDKRVTVAIVKLTGEQIKTLKNKGSSIGHGSRNIASVAQRPFTTFEVVSGHLWRCVTKARYEGNGEQSTILSTAVDCRNRFRPPLPDCYAGTAVFPTVTPTCSFHDLIHKPLSYAAGNVRQAIERVTDDFLRSVLDYIASEKRMNLFKYHLGNPAGAAPSLHKNPSRGKPNLAVTSWMNFSFKDADFGWGKPVYVGPGSMYSEGKAYVMNNTNGDGIIVAIALEASHMNAFKKLFYKDIQEVLPTSKY